MSRLVCIIGLSVVVLAFCTPATFANESQEREKFESTERETLELVDVSLPTSFRLTPPERIQEFRCLILGGILQRIYTPRDWDIVIDNSSEAVGARTEVKAQFDVGIALFDNRNLGYFQDFMTIAWLKEYRYHDVLVELTIDTMDAHTKTIKFHTKQLVLRPVNRPFHPF
jgi:hypothetical protein